MVTDSTIQLTRTEPPTRAGEFRARRLHSVRLLAVEVEAVPGGEPLAAAALEVALEGPRSGVGGGGGLANRLGGVVCPLVVHGVPQP